LAAHQQQITKTRKLFQLPAPTRISSTSNLLLELLKHRKALKAAVWDPKLPTDKKSKKQIDKLRQMICSNADDFWPTLKRVSDVLEPLKIAINQIQGSAIDVRQALYIVDQAFVNCLEAVLVFDDKFHEEFQEGNV
jgi:esterase/lipase